MIKTQNIEAIFTQKLKMLYRYIFLYGVCIFFFFSNPCLSLQKTIKRWQHNEEAMAFLQHIVWKNTLQGVLLFLLIITLIIFLQKRYKMRCMICCLISCSIVLWNLPSISDFPTLGQVSLVFVYDQCSLLGEIKRYHLLLTWLKGWCVLLMICVISMHFIIKRKVIAQKVPPCGQKLS